MARYIDADKLKKEFPNDTDWEYPVNTNKYVCMVIDAQPSADVRENVRGEWKIKAINTYELAYGSTGYEPVYECSVCGCVEESYLRLDEPIMPEDADFPNFCPNCGADMRGDKDETD